MQVAQEVLAVLDRGNIEGRFYKLPAGQLDRALYLKVNQILELAGGKWDKKAKAHHFAEQDAADALEPVFLTGEITDAKKEFQFFETPPQIVNRILAAAGPLAGLSVLEPSAGRGAIALRAQETAGQVCMVELNPKNAAWLRANGDEPEFRLREGDFLAMEADPVFDRVLMNPPFAKQADAKHILHAYKWLKPGGRLVAIASAGVNYRESSFYEALRGLISECGSIEDLPTGSFQTSGTMVNTVLIVLEAAS